MVRWEPGARGRLQEAAMALYVERGYEGTTVAAIADRAGLTERTFFRHFADKREVLFSGSAALQDAMVGGLVGAPPGTSPLAAVGAALDAAGEVFRDAREHARRRQALVAGQPELLERELMKLARLTAALADGLRQRGVAEPAASLAAEAGIAVFRSGFERWVAAGEDRPLAAVLRDQLAVLQSVAAEG